VLIGSNIAANNGLIPIPASRRSLANSVLPWKNSADAASIKATGTATSVHFNQGREHTARASDLPSRSKRASAEVIRTSRYWQLAVFASPREFIAILSASSVERPFAIAAARADS
jgi:Tfp pilus assembly protein PilX